jgi:mono/diheme cytochrome c family protein
LSAARPTGKDSFIVSNPERRFGWLARILLLAVVLGAAGAAGIRWWRTHNIGPVERGGLVAVRHGCMSCHAVAGRPEDPHPDGTGGAPSFSREDVAEYARNQGEIREWIRDWKPQRLRDEEGDAPPVLLSMPAFRDALSEREVDELVAWVVAVSDFEQMPEPARAGRDLASRLGCFGCHGPGGRGDTPNPGSLKGHIPSWSGADYPELVRDEGELAEWIREGSPKRLRENPVAAFFLRRQLVRMPAFGPGVTEQEVHQIGAYIRWLRQRSTGAQSGN